MEAPETAFLKAAYENNLKILKKLATKAGDGMVLTKAYELIKDPLGRNALHLAAAAGNTHICKFLVEKLNYNIDSGDFVGHTPLVLAILSLQQHPTTIYLIENGAGLDCANHWGYTPLLCAAELGNNEIMRLLLSKGAKPVPDPDTTACTPLQSSCALGNAEAVKLLLDYGADPNSFTKLYFTPLMLSIVADSYECVELLLKAGADPNHYYCGKTPLMIAARGSDARFINCLLEAGANPNDVNIYGLMTPIEFAVLSGNLSAMIVLFPCTSRISSFPDWSINGIMRHIYSEEETAKREIRRKEDFEVSKARGREAFGRKDYEDAIQWYSQALGADATDAAVLSNRSLCWVKVKQPKRALEDAKACVALKPDWPKAHYREGSALMLFHEYSLASEAFSKALELDPNNKDIKEALRETKSQYDMLR